MGAPHRTASAGECRGGAGPFAMRRILRKRWLRCSDAVGILRPVYVPL